MNKAALDEQNRQVVEEFRRAGGRVGGPFAGTDVLLLHHQGAKTGTRRINPLVYTAQGDDYVVVASAGGQPRDPQWFVNLMAHPDTEIEVGDRRLAVRARTARGEERERRFRLHVEAMPFFAGYAEAAAGARELPVVVLEPSSGGSG